jgi:proteic killer suppression protein
MRIVFRDQRLALVRTDQAAKTKLPIPVIKSCREKLNFLEAASEERALRNWKSLRYEKLEGNRKGLRSVRLNDQWRLVFALDETTSPPTIEVVDIEDYHR